MYKDNFENCDSSAGINRFAMGSRESNLGPPAVSSSGHPMQVPVSEVPEPYNRVFAQFEYFNPIQSAVFQDVFYSDRSVAISAPTGSGKTAIFELAIVKLLLNFEVAQPTEDYKVIYIAPMKALCEERLVDWHAKFAQFGFNCISVTGDSEDVDIQNLFAQNLIITTPEKWDSVTRRWRDNEKLVASVRLFLIDEIHLINDENRGATLEAIITRMKTIYSSGRMEVDTLRFVGASATVSNIEDIAEWFNTPSSMAKSYKFKDNMRPVQLQKIVLGYPYNPSLSSPFKFDIMLSYKLHHILLQYSCGKPTLVFCSTRKSVDMTSKQLIQNLTIALSSDQRKILVGAASEISNPKLTETLIHGVGSHHAGMLPEHRRLIENLFRETHLPVLVTTSTLAMGVNLPAHLVVIKSTKYYVSGEYRNYGESMLFQMIGRAGRPQFDTSGTAVIMTTTADKYKFENMISGEQPLESHLRKNLVEFINAEVVLRTITDLSVAMQWLSSTFLYIRARKNPKYYNLPIGLSLAQLDKKLLEMCQIEVNKLCRVGMLTMDTDVTILPTETGCLMARYCVSFETMKLFIETKGTEILQQVLALVSKCVEFQEIRLRSNDKSSLNVLNKCRNRETIRFPLNGRIRTLDMKINCIIQAVLGCLEIRETSLLVEAQRIMRIGERLLTCLVEYLKNRGNCYQALLNSIILLKCLRARIWENSLYVSRQLNGIGSTLSSNLFTAGKTSFQAILEANPRDLERIVNKKPPFGSNLQDQVKLIPIYSMKTDLTEDGEHALIKITVTMENASNFNQKMTVNPKAFMHLIAGDNQNNLLLHKHYSHVSMTDHVTIIENIEVIAGREEEVTVSWISEDWVGFDCRSKIALRSDKTKEKSNTKTDERVAKMPKSKSGERLAKSMKKRAVFLQQPMDRYFKTVKSIKRKKSAENNLSAVPTRSSEDNEEPSTEENKVQESLEQEIQSGGVDEDVVESTQAFKEKSENELEDVEKKIFAKSIAAYLNCLNKKVLSKNVNSENLSIAIEEMPLEGEPGLKYKTENVLKSIENNQNYMRANKDTPDDVQRQVTKIVKPLTKPKKEMIANRDFATSAMELEASLLRICPAELKQFSLQEKKKLTPESKAIDSQKFECKTITWRSPLIETMNEKYTPPPESPPKQKSELIRQKFQPHLKGRVPPYSLSDKDWAFTVQKCEDVISKSLMETLFGPDQKPIEKPAEPDLNATLSSNSSIPKSVKTTFAESVSSYTGIGYNVMAEKIKCAVPKINDEVSEERKAKKEESKANVGDEGLNGKKWVEGEELLPSTQSWEKDFLSNDMEKFFATQVDLPENKSGEDLEFKKFKELEDVIIKQRELPLDPGCSQRYRLPVKKSSNQTQFLFGNEERLSPSNCDGFSNLKGSENVQTDFEDELFSTNNYGLHKNRTGFKFDCDDFLGSGTSKRTDELFLEKSSFERPRKRSTQLYQQPITKYAQIPSYKPPTRYRGDDIFGPQPQNFEGRYRRFQNDYDFPTKFSKEYPLQDRLQYAAQYPRHRVPIENRCEPPYIPQPRRRRYRDPYRPYPPMQSVDPINDYNSKSMCFDLDRGKYRNTCPEDRSEYFVPPRHPEPLRYNEYHSYSQQYQPTNYDYDIRRTDMSNQPPLFSNMPTRKPRISPFETTYGNIDDLDGILSFDPRHQERVCSNESMFPFMEKEDTKPIPYSTGEKEYLMKRFMTSQPSRSTDFNHTITSNEMDVFDVIDYKNY